eukprot:CAMPEP_0194764924 /NCGR_PEP_ID=MMETSP0323_2-20130528/23997_1 /TAXON_ID=2866 ORGANISM="Crypthecodinium cohnii, Strain Seligo" /NCGR_SAMPLE_ID=MMETSP0323_2 /ASSEMBLY_ACC=CAM_ASM_000346 /LENGTH=167 /DNA_ID=CAMNT_0039693177 /DNA_START=68 /DNA_END=569 /DNA_ORIENTATION=+
MAEEEEDTGPPPGPVVDVSAIALSPEGESRFEDPLDIVMNFSTDTTLDSFCWRFSYTVDTSRKRKIIDLGSTDLVCYPEGAHQMAFSAPGFDINAVPNDIRTQVNGLLACVLTGPNGEEVMTVNMVVQLYMKEGMLMRFIFNPLIDPTMCTQHPHPHHPSAALAKKK